MPEINPLPHLNETFVQAHEKVVGFWVGAEQYQMYHERSHTTRNVFVPGANDPMIYDGAELEDAIYEAREHFAVEMADRNKTYKPMTRDKQHELAPQLKEIEESKSRREDVGHGRYW